MSELYIKQELFKILPQLDAIIFDVDGVLLDVSESFRAVITDTVQHFATQALGLKDTGPLLTVDETELFKFAGGFNDDAELTCAAVAAVIAKWAQTGAQDTETLRNAEPTWLDFTTHVKRLGGGIASAEAHILETLTPSQRRDFARQWNTRLITRAFQERYAGDDACKELYDFEPEYIHGDGYYKREKALIDTSLLPGKVKFGLLTGRTVTETRLALRLAKLTNRIPETAWVTADDGVKKPDGRTLFLAREKMDFKNALYIGDTVDDLKTVTNYRDTKGAGRARIASAITLSGPTGSLHRRAFLEADVDITAPDVNFLLQYLRALLK